MRTTGKAALAAVVLGLVATGARADGMTYCVTCSEPDRTYRCEVATPGGDPGEKALQLYCMVKSAKEGSHRSCAATREQAGKCPGVVKRYTYDGPGALPGIRSAVREYRDMPPAPPPPGPPSTSEEEKPSTLFGLTSRAVKASGRGVKKTGGAVVKVTKGAGGLVGDAARGAKRRVGSAGATIGDAARSALDCVKKLFRRCGDDENEEATAEDKPVRLTPQAARPE